MKKAGFALAVLLFGAAGVAFADSPVPSIIISDVGGQDATLGSVTLTVPSLPVIVSVDGTGSINQSTLDGATLTLTDNGVPFYSGQYWQGIGNVQTAPFSVHWTISSAGTHSIVGTISHSNNDGTDTVDVVVNLAVVTVNQCPAAPAIAAAYMQSKGVKGGSKEWQAVITAVAGQTGVNGSLFAAHSCDSGYAAAVIAYMKTLGYTNLN